MFIFLECTQIYFPGGSDEAIFVCSALSPISICSQENFNHVLIEISCVCVSMCGYVHVCAGTLTGQKRESDALELELKAV